MWSLSTGNMKKTFSDVEERLIVKISNYPPLKSGDLLEKSRESRKNGKFMLLIKVITIKRLQ